MHIAHNRIYTCCFLSGPDASPFDSLFRDHDGSFDLIIYCKQFNTSLKLKSFDTFTQITLVEMPILGNDQVL